MIFCRRFFRRATLSRAIGLPRPPSCGRESAKTLARLLDLSLLIEGGTRPLLAQFLEDARRARGETEAAPSAVGGVRLMTIHAAKGLQSPIVILADADFSKRVHGGADILG